MGDETNRRVVSVGAIFNEYSEITFDYSTLYLKLVLNGSIPCDYIPEGYFGQISMANIMGVPDEGMRTKLLMRANRGSKTE